METAAQTCLRLVAALEDLVAQERVCLQVRDFAAVVSIQERAEPLVAHLAAHAGDVTDGNLRQRIAAIVTHREETGAWLKGEIERTRQQLHGIEAGQRRAARVAPAYGSSHLAPRSKLSVVG